MGCSPSTFGSFLFGVTRTRFGWPFISDFLLSWSLTLQRRCQCRRAASVAGRTAAHITRICDLVAAVRDGPELSGRSAPASDPRGVLAVALCRKPREVDPGVDL